MNALKMELYELVDRLPESQVSDALDFLRRLVDPASLRRQSTGKPFAWVGMIKNGAENASSPEYIDSVLAKGFGRQ